MDPSKEKPQGTSALVYILVIMFGISPWLIAQSILTEIPLMVNVLPEYWNLSAYVGCISQIGNLALLLYVIYQRMSSNTFQDHHYTVYMIFLIQMVCCLLTMFFWDVTSVIAGVTHSTALFVLTGCVSVADATAGVAFLVYMGSLKPEYMSAQYVGQGLNGLITASIGLLQGTGHDAVCVNTSVEVTNPSTGINHTQYFMYPTYAPPNFSVETFMGITFAITCMSAISFFLLHNLPYCQRLGRDHTFDADSYKIEVELSKSLSQDTLEATPFSQVSLGNSGRKSYLSTENSGSTCAAAKLSKCELKLFLLISFWTNICIYGIVPSTLPYTCLPYGNEAFSLAERLYFLTNPLACFVAFFKPRPPMTTVVLLILLGTSLIGFQLWLAALSPSPPLQFDQSGKAIVIMSAIAIMACLGYVRTCPANAVAHAGDKEALVWVGFVEQAGFLVGAVIAFLFVDIFSVFQQIPPCDMPNVLYLND